MGNYNYYQEKQLEECMTIEEKRIEAIFEKSKQSKYQKICDLHEEAKKFGISEQTLYNLLLNEYLEAETFFKEMLKNMLENEKVYKKPEYQKYEPTYKVMEIIEAMEQRDDIDEIISEAYLSHKDGTAQINLVKILKEKQKILTK